ncbi:site-2 protease Metallo peptidase MEROPS family M50B [Fusobacterium sp. CAG:439]|nr:site-2 protease Metallo peptidase MEROPS family M50B [Fusobacterium sp. CAG:439]
MSVIIMILLIGLLILVHELGHLGAALLFKVKVDKFGIGLPIGPTLWEKKVGNITLIVHAFLFGGYVSFPDDDKDSNLPQNSPDRLMNKPIWQRAIIFSAGVIANVICAYVLVLLTAALWHNMPSGKFDIYVNDIVAPKEASVWQSGLKKGDKIIEVNGSQVNTKYGLNLYALYSASFDGKTNEGLAEKNCEYLKKLNPAYTKDEIIPEGLIVKIPEQIQKEEKVVLSRNVLNAVELYKPDETKLSDEQIKLRDKAKDQKFIETDGTFSLKDLAYALSDSERPLDIKVLRNGEVVALKTVYSDKDGLIGITLDRKEVLIPITGVKSAFSASWNYLYNETKSMIIVLKQLFTGKIPLKNMHGVVLITKMGGDIISSEGIFYGILLTAVISMNLAILNILPIPALDGGHLLFLIIEKIQGKPVDEEIANKIMTVFFSLLILLLVFVLFNDIYVLVKPLFIK